MIQRAVRQGAPVSRYAYDSVVRYLARSTAFDKIPEVLDSMKKHGVPPQDRLLAYIARMQDIGGFDYHDPKHVPADDVEFEALYAQAGSHAAAEGLSDHA